MFSSGVLDLTSLSSHQVIPWSYVSHCCRKMTVEMEWKWKCCRKRQFQEEGVYFGSQFNSTADHEQSCWQDLDAAVSIKSASGSELLVSAQQAEWWLLMFSKFWILCVVQNLSPGNGTAKFQGKSSQFNKS